MEQTTNSTPPQNPQPPPATTTSAAVSAASSSLAPPSTLNSNPTTTAKPLITPQSQPSTAATSSQTRPPFNTRPWQQPPYSHLSVPSSSSVSTPSSVSGIAIGVPAHNPSAAAPQPPPASFSSLAPPSYGQQAQIRQPMPGMGMAGALGTTSSMRPAGVASQQLRPTLRPQTSPNSQTPASQSFQGHGMLRVSSLGTSGSSAPNSSQNSQPHNQPWLSSSTQGKPPLPTPSPRAHATSQPFQPRSITPPPHHHNIPTTLQQQPASSSQQQAPHSSGLSQQQEHYTQQFPASRSQQSISHQQQITRGPGLVSQRPPLGLMQSGASQPGAHSKAATVDAEESSDRIVSKRSIHELINQIDPSEKLDPEVEDALVEIAEDFVESITTFGCSLAKHRKSTTLEAKDILLHLERNWNMTLPGFGGDEIKTYKKPIVSEIHRERLAAIKKSSLATDVASKNASGPSGGNAKGHPKGPASAIGSPPNPKIREAA